MSKTIFTAILILLMSLTAYGESDTFLETLAGAESGDPNAQFSLGLNYYLGQGIEQNYKEAFNWFTKAAEQGWVVAQCFAAGDVFEKKIVL